MIQMPVNKDVRSFQPKFIGPFSKRQFMSLLPAGLITAFLILVVGKFVPGEFLYILAAIIDIPIVACGFIDIQGMPLKTFFTEVILTKAAYPKARHYRTENIYEIYSKQNTISYAYFDGDTMEYTGKQLIRKQKEYQKRLQQYLKLNPEMKPIDKKTKR